MHHHHFAADQLDSLDLAGFAGAFTFSFLASLHCAAMCTPLVCARLGTRASALKLNLWLYNAGRLVSYTSAGFLAGGIGKQATKFLGLAGPLATALGAALIFYGIFRVYKKPDRRPKLMLTSWLGNAGDFGLGLLTVMLPCATLTPALLAAAVSGAPQRGATIMFAFFLGTLPIMVLSPAFPGIIRDFLPGSAGEKIPRTLSRLAGPALLILAGAITIARAWH